MSKRIINNGKYNSVECLEADNGCGCKFAFDKEDIIIKENGDTIVTCPQCDRECLVPTKTQGAN